MAKLNLQDIKDGTLVNKSHLVTVDFVTMDEEMASIEVQLKQLPYIETEKLHKRLADNDSSVISEWVSKSIVNDEGKPEFTKKQVDELFSGELVTAVFNQILKVEQVKKLKKANPKV